MYVMDGFSDKRGNEFEQQLFARIGDNTDNRTFVNREAIKNFAFIQKSMLTFRANIPVNKIK